MPAEPLPCPASRAQVVDLYFMEHRAKLIDLAAFLDRYERATPAPGTGAGTNQQDDFRIAALRQAIAILQDGKPHRAARILDLFSDHTSEPIPQAPMKGALGAAPS